MIDYKVTINDIDYTYFVSLPITEQYALDESLDNGVLVLKFTKIDTIFKPYSKVVITYGNGDQTTYYVAQDKMTHIVGGDYYNHQLTLIEETKILEKIIVDTNTITQPLLSEYSSSNNYGYVNSMYMDNLTKYPYGYLQKQLVNAIYGLLQDTGTIALPAPEKVLSCKSTLSEHDNYYDYITNNGITGWSFTVYNEDGYIVYENYGNSGSDLAYTTSVANITVNNNQIYKVVYWVQGVVALSNRQLTKTIYVSIVNPNLISEYNSQKYTITDVVNRLLNICETLKNNETAQFTFNNEQATEYSQIISPEFAFTRSTLKECLDQVGGYIHAIPRLENDVIYFDKLGQTNDEGLPTPTYSYYINYEPDVSGSLDVHINFIVNNTQYTNISTHGGDLWYNEEAVYSIFGAVGTRWKHENSPYTNLDYRKIEFLERPTGNLLTWLENNAEREKQPAQMPLNYIGEIKSQNIEQYCTNIDTHVDNLVNLEDTKTGTIIEPYYNGFETVRAETGVVRITDDTAIIETEYPIEKIAQLKVGYVVDINNTEVSDIDITQYVYESAEYQALSSYQSAYPYSKAYAIYYTQGQNNIYGLNFKMENAISPIFEHYSLINILEKASGHTFTNLINVKPFVQLNFQIVYYPIVTARLGQSKQDLREYDRKITSIYNQSANMIDSTAYGENLKGAVARLGNVDIQKTYLFPSYDYIYPVGTLVDDDYYISTVDLELFGNYIKCTYGLSKDFNRLSQYIGIKNNIRMYEVSEKQAVDRYILSEDYIIIGESKADNSNLPILCSKNVYDSFINDIEGTNTVLYPTLAICSTNVSNKKFALPVVSLGIGNSLLYTFSFKDNYSAGNVASEGSYNDTFNVQTYAPYGNMIGRFDTINIKFSLTAQQPTDQTSAVNIGNALPLIDNNNGAYTPYEFSNADLKVYKDNRERLIFNHQVHFVTNWDGIIIGSDLATTSHLIGGDTSASAWKLYILPNKINKFNKDIDLTGAEELSNDMATDYTISGDTINYNEIYFEDNPTATVDGKAWAVVKTVNGENKLLFGRNIDIIENEEIELPTISLVHKIFD